MNIEQELIGKITSELARAGSTIEVETNLAGIVDSTAMMELVVWIGDKFGIEVEIDDITPDNFGSVRKLADYVKKKKA
ncbi:MAG: acyl carrier protein [Myxococcota bacterium]